MQFDFVLFGSLSRAYLHRHLPTFSICATASMCGCGCCAVVSCLCMSDVCGRRACERTRQNKCNISSWNWFSSRFLCICSVCVTMPRGVYGAMLWYDCGFKLEKYNNGMTTEKEHASIDTITYFHVPHLISTPENYFDFSKSKQQQQNKTL